MLVVVAVLGFACAVLPALASTPTIRATSSNTWSPSTVTVTAGDTVHFSDTDDGTHNLRFDGEAAAVTPLSSSWTYDRTFASAGSFGFYCEVHPRMTGTVIVQAASTTTTSTGTTSTSTGGTTTTSTTTSPTTSTTTSGGQASTTGGSTTTGGAGATTTPSPTAGFASSPRRLRVSAHGRFRYRFRATPSSGGTFALRSVKQLRVGAVRRRVRVGPVRFIASSTGHVLAKAKLARSGLRALRRVGRIRFRVVVVLGGQTFTAHVTLLAP
ncbi:cupredoxin domain-containing protein [Paraconexibacter antarcticus]|uniref:Cupredoxin domain-containing protein n=1 Tax=Paraconexibacter antarcticus TaxID=2949664 RepID=A0ABY5DZM2_9ACTN|nr:plastocyanin/azurin family copper-binding protein [Paraconexibacter antarcticus]UTI64363.1 cupredoxin domain-containing protein [Paraconexibacter antarcticus]UTI66793.1 cupredoxin domain-containing protein [Paraconexibacter antarcticus]